MIMTHHYSKATLRRRLAYGRRRRCGFIKLGLRTDGKPRIGKKPCGCLFGSCLKCAKTTNALILKPKLITAMWADYSDGMSLTGVAKKYGKHRKSLNQVFGRRGLKLRPVKTVPRLGFGVRIPDPAHCEIKAMIAQLKHLAVPAPMKQVWKRWSFPQRQAFIKKLRIKFPSTMPTGKFSANVTPFKYGDAHVHAIADKLNVGRTSQTKVVSLKPGSEGVIYQGVIFFWTTSTGPNSSGPTGYQAWRFPNRKSLHRVIWEQTHGRPVPEKFTVIHSDGNKNNFTSANLKLRSKADCARQNAWHRHPEKHPGIAQRIANKAWDTKNQQATERSRLLVKQMLAPKNETSLLAQLQRRKTNENN